MSRQIDGGAHLALACMYALYKTWGKYPREIAHIMQEILELERKHYEEGEGCMKREIDHIAESDKMVEQTDESTQNVSDSDLISRKAVTDALAKFVPYAICDESTESYANGLTDAYNLILQLPFAQPEITDEQAIEHLQSTGWMQNHDREMYGSGLREQLADDSGSYDSLVPCDDTISRQAAIDIERNATVDTNPSHFEAHQKFTQFMDDAEVSSFGRWQWSNGFNTALTAVGIDLKKLPSVQPEVLAHGEGELIAQPEPHWIPCSERLPKDGVYLVYAPDYQGGSSSSKEWHDGVMFAKRKSGKWSIEHGYYSRPNCVKAWMPLPAPYQGGDE